MSWLASLLTLVMVAVSSASPFGGWGPGEGFGHLGRRPPPSNPNSNFGFDFFGTTHNRFNYSAVVMKHSEPRSMRDPKFVSVAAKVPHHQFRETYLRSGAKRKSKKFQKHRSEIKPKNSMKFRRGKDFPIKNVKADPFFKQKKPAPRSKVSRPGVKHSRKSAPRRNWRKLSKLRSRKAGQTGLNASDLWMLNSASNQFSKTMRKQGRQGRHGRHGSQGRHGRHGRHGRKGRSKTTNIQHKEGKDHGQRPVKSKKKFQQQLHNRRRGRFTGRRLG